MLTRKQKNYIYVFFVVVVVCSFIYEYTYKKGYAEGRTGFTETAQKVLTKKEKSDSSTSDYNGIYQVIHVADGDTVDILKDGTKVRIRLLGINSPESVDPRRPTECYGREAKEYMTELTQGKKVRILLDSLKPEKDEYQRVLAYIWREDGLFLNKDMIEKGYAYEYTYHGEGYKFQNEFKSDQKIAKEKAIGLWSQATCSGKK